MTHSHSIYPVDHDTKEVADQDLRGLVERHHVAYELGPHQVLGPDRSIIRRGWVVDLYGRESEADSALPFGSVTHHVHDVLHAIAATLVPEARRGEVTSHLERFTGAVHLDPKRGFAEEVRLRIQLEPMTTARMSMLGDLDTDWRDEITARLSSLGAKQRGS